MSNLFLIIFIISFLCIPLFIIWALINLVRKQPAKRYVKLSGISILLSIISFLAFGFALDNKTDTATNTAIISEQNSSDEPVNQEPLAASPAPVPNIEQKGTGLESQKEQSEKNNNDVKTTVKSGTYDIAGESFSFSNSVINDVTGKWRLSLIASSKEPTEYAIDYYNTLFSSDDEIHAVVNFTLNTTNKISVLYDGMLDVTVYEYVDKEEHDAKALFGGMLLGEYWINTETGEIEALQSSTNKQPDLKDDVRETVENFPDIESNNTTDETPLQDNVATPVSNTSSDNNSSYNFNTYDNPSQQQTADNYVLNTGTYKFHYPSCGSVAQIAPQNYSTSNSSRSEIIAQGYSPCGRCNP